MPSVMQVVYSFAIGGSEVLGYNIARFMKHQGWESSLCAVEYGGDLEALFEQDGLPFVALSRSTSPQLSTFVNMMRFFRKHRPDVVHTHHVYDLMYAVVPALLCGARIIHTEHEYYSLQGKKTPILRFLSRFCAAVTGVSEEVTEFLERVVKIDSHKLHTIKNGIDTEKFSGKTTITRQDIGIAEDHFLIGVVARLEPEKNHETLIEAFAALCKERPNCSLVIVGDGSQRVALQHLATSLNVSRQVHFLGTRLDIPDLLSLLDVFALTSRREGLPISILEAMSCGKPIIASDVGSVRSVVIPGANGYLMEPGDVPILKTFLMTLIDDALIRSAFGKESRMIIDRSYDSRHSMNSYVRLYMNT